MADDDKKDGSTAKEDEQADDLRMPVLEHIGELRKRIFAILAVLVVGMVVGLMLARPAYQFLMSREPVSSLQMHAFSLWDGIGMYMKFSLVIALVPAIPFALFQLWSFVKPALAPRERKATLRYVPFALLMFLAGLAFAYFVVFPLAFTFTTEVARGLNLEETYGVTQYFSFLFNLLVPISLLFELPILIMFLTRIGILNPYRLRKMRRVAYFALVFVGVIITPPDFISDMLVALPLVLLYEFSVYLSMMVYRKREEERRAREEQFEGAT